LKTLISNYKIETPIDVLFERLTDLKNYFISKNHALTTYDKQQYKQNLDSIELSLFQLKDKVKPRKRFAFRKLDKETKKEDEKINIEDAKTHEKNLFQIDGVVGFVNVKKIINNEKRFTSFQIEGNVGCEIQVNSLFDCLFIKNNQNCVIKVGPAKSSVFVDNNQGCDIHIIGHQVPFLIIKIQLI
jgi:Tubulin binding cofactor C